MISNCTRAHAQRLPSIVAKIKELETKRLRKRYEKGLMDGEGTAGTPALRTESDFQQKLARYLLENNYESASELCLTVGEGKHRMVRRMLHNAGHSVVYLERVRYGECQLGGLAEGCVRSVTDNELEWLKTFATKYRLPKRKM